MADNGLKKTNAARLLDQMKVRYELIPYEVDEEHLGAEHTAEILRAAKGTLADLIV